MRTCVLERSPYPNPGTTIRSRPRPGLLPFSISRHLVEPALRASPSFHLFPREGGGLGWSQSCRWCTVGLETRVGRGVWGGWEGEMGREWRGLQPQVGGWVVLRVGSMFLGV